MKALDFLKSLDGISFGTDAPKESLYEAIAELEALQQPKSCDGCKHEKDDDYCEFMGCIRNAIDRYEPKETK